MVRKAVCEETKWQIINMKDDYRVSNRGITNRLLISENCIKIFKMTGGIHEHTVFGRKNKKNHGSRELSYNSSSKSQPKVKLM